MQCIIGMVQILWFLLNLHQLYWTLTQTPFRYSIFVYCYGDPADLELKVWTLHKLQHVIGEEGVRWINS